MSDFLSNHGVRVYAVLSALVPVLVLVWPDVPWEALVSTSAALLGVGVVASVHEDSKTVKALYALSPFEDETEHLR